VDGINGNIGWGLQSKMSGFLLNAFALLLEVVSHMERKLRKMSAQDRKVSPRLKGYMRASVSSGSEESGSNRSPFEIQYSPSLPTPSGEVSKTYVQITPMCAPLFK
jgi:hypothetical protein